MIEQKAKKANIDPAIFINDFFNHYLDWWRVKEIEKVSNLSVRLLNLIMKFYYFRCISKGGEVKYLRYDAILRDKRSPFLLWGLDEYDEDHVKQIISDCSGFRRDELYLVLKYPDYLLGEILFESIGVVSGNFTSFIDMEESDELEGIIPKTWKLARFKNYKTSRFIELVRPYGKLTVVNIDNGFVDLLIKGKQNITGDRKIAIEGFFRSLKMDVKWNFEGFIKKQKEILKWLVDDGLISEDEIDNYILTKEVFPLHMLKGS